MSDTATAILDIDLGALRDNIKLLQQKAPGAKLAGVVKANAYGLGVADVAPVFRQMGVESFFVATLEEGIALRGILGAGPEIFVLCGLMPGAAAVYVAHDLTPVLNDLGQVAEWRTGRPAMLHIDTGMRRLGLDTGEIKTVMADPSCLDGVNLTGVMSHFACADEPGHDLTGWQYAAFTDFTDILSRRFPGLRRSLCNSAGLFASADYHFDLVRPGMAVYGLNPVPGQPNPMRSVVGLKTRILQVHDALAGESIGYGAIEMSRTKRRVATVGLGYADGFLRSLSRRGQLFWQGQACPILGRVSMDLVIVDVTGVSAPEPVAGDWLEVLGPQQDADRLAHDAGTIGYEILIQLGPRYTRRVHNA